MTKNNIFISQIVFRNPYNTHIACYSHHRRLNTTYRVGGQNDFTFFIFLYFCKGEGCVTRVVPLAPGPCDDAGIIHMFP